MPSNRTPTRFFGPAYLVSASATLYTVPANKIAVVRQITIRFSEGPEVGTFYIGTTAGDKQFFEISGDGNSDSKWFYLPLAEGELLIGASDFEDEAVIVTVDGDLYDE